MDLFTSGPLLGSKRNLNGAKTFDDTEEAFGLNRMLNDFTYPMDDGIYETNEPNRAARRPQTVDGLQETNENWKELLRRKRLADPPPRPKLWY